MRRKEMFYLMMHSTHFIYGYIASESEEVCFFTQSIEIILK